MQSHPASYKDSEGFVFQHNGKIYRYFHNSYQVHYIKLMKSGLYDELVKKAMLITHQEITESEKFDFVDGSVLLPDQIPYISYPYEWSFDMWKDAALLSLRIAMASIKTGLPL